MARQITTKTAAKDFFSIYNSAYLLARIAEADAALDWDGINTDQYHPRQSRKIIALAFMNIVGAWEEFLEAAFVRYLAGGRSYSGYGPTFLLGPCNSIDHGYKILSGRHDYSPDKNHMSWTNFDAVLAKASLFFEGATPFSNIPAVDRQRISDAVIIRNRVAHASQKCRQQFKNVASNHLRTKGLLPRGFDPGTLLINECMLPFSALPATPCIYLDAYFEMFARSVKTICP